MYITVVSILLSGAANSALMGGHTDRVPAGTTMTLSEAVEVTPSPSSSQPPMASTSETEPVTPSPSPSPPIATVVGLWLYCCFIIL